MFFIKYFLFESFTSLPAQKALQASLDVSNQNIVVLWQVLVWKRLLNQPEKKNAFVEGML